MLRAAPRRGRAADGGQLLAKSGESPDQRFDLVGGGGHRRRGGLGAGGLLRKYAPLEGRRILGELVEFPVGDRNSISALATQHRGVLAGGNDVKQGVPNVKPPRTGEGPQNAE